MGDFGLSFPAQINIRPLLPLRKDVQEDQERTQGSKTPAQSISRGQENYQDEPRGPHKTGFEHAAGRRKQRAPYPRSVTSITDAPPSHHTYESAEPRDYDWRRDFHLPNVPRSELSPSPRPPSSPPSNSRYETLKTLNTRPHASSGCYLVQDRQTKTLFIEKRLRTSTPTSRAHAEAQESALWQLKSSITRPLHPQPTSFKSANPSPTTTLPPQPSSSNSLPTAPSPTSSPAPPLPPRIPSPGTSSPPSLPPSAPATTASPLRKRPSNVPKEIGWRCTTSI